MRRVDQYVHTLRLRDAVSDEVRLFRDRLRERGFVTAIVVAGADAAVAHEVEPFEPRRPIAADAVLYHHATAASVGRRLARWKGRTALLYHGVTPPELIRPYDPALAALLGEGRQTLARIAPHFVRRFADSAFGAAELGALAGVRADVLPFCLDVRRFRDVHAETDGRRDGVHWLTVGRVAPNKGLLALVTAFAAFARTDPHATLTIVGAYAPTEPYYWAVRRAIDAGGVYGRVRLAGSVDDAALVRSYAQSDVYVCLSEHEGFCVPLVEAMFFDLPIVALARAAVPETLAGAGILVSDNDPATVARAVASLADAPFREAVLAAQRVRRAAFDPARTMAAFDRAIDELVTG